MDQTEQTVEPDYKTLYVKLKSEHEKLKVNNKDMRRRVSRVHTLASNLQSHRKIFEVDKDALVRKLRKIAWGNDKPSIHEAGLVAYMAAEGGTSH